MRSRISFGLSLAFDFDVYISDEATAVGDRAFKAKAKALFESKIGKASLIMVSHSEGILKDLCQAGLYLKEGSAYWYDDINEAIAAYHADVDAKKKAGESDLPSDVNGARRYLAECHQILKGAQATLNDLVEEDAPKEQIKAARQEVHTAGAAAKEARLHIEALEEKQRNAKQKPA